MSCSHRIHLWVQISSTAQEHLGLEQSFSLLETDSLTKTLWDMLASRAWSKCLHEHMALPASSSSPPIVLTCPRQLTAVCIVFREALQTFLSFARNLFLHPSLSWRWPRKWDVILGDEELPMAKRSPSSPWHQDKRERGNKLLWVSVMGEQQRGGLFLCCWTLLVVQGHPSELHHIWYHGNWVMWFPRPRQKLLAKSHMGINPLGPRSAKKKKTKQVRSSAENLPDLLRWVLMIIERLVWLSADSVQARLHCAPSAFQSHLNSCQCLIIPPFPS